MPSGFTWDVVDTGLSLRLVVTGTGLSGDFNSDGSLDCSDIDALTAAVAAGSSSSTFDMTNDGMVTGQDIVEWIVNIKGTLLGDANLDYSVDGADLLIWNAAKSTSAVGWCNGDFNGSGTTDAADFVIWNNHKFQTALPPSIPEPGAGVMFLAGLVWLVMRRRNVA